MAKTNQSGVSRSPLPPLTVGVMGSAGGALAPEVRRIVRELGKDIAQRGYVLITGAAPGLPQDAVLGAMSEGGLCGGHSPHLNPERQSNKHRPPTRGYENIIYTGSGLMGREIENIRSCDVVIFAGGRSGSLGEFAIAYDEGKVIGVLTGTGGIADRLKEIIQMVNKTTEAYVCYHSDPQSLLDDLEQVYNERILPGYLSTIEGHDPDGVLDP